MAMVKRGRAKAHTTVLGGGKYASAGIVKRRSPGRAVSYQQTAREQILHQQRAKQIAAQEAEVLRQKTIKQRQAENLARAREALAAKRAKAYQTQLTKERSLGQARATKALDEPLMKAPPRQSSNIWKIGYDLVTRILRIDFNSGARYEYFEVPPDIAADVVKGAQTAVTTGENKWGKWWSGKNPSVGAAVYRLIVKGGYKYRLVFITAPRPATRTMTTKAKPPATRSKGRTP